MENEVDISGKIKSWIIVGVVSLVTFILVFFVTNMLVNGNKKDDETETSVEENVTYAAYAEGDAVTLKNGTKWHVLYDSKKDEQYITLLSDEDVNDSDVLYGNVNSFLRGTYKTNLIKTLVCDSADIVEVRLLAYLDLSTIAKANSSEFLPGVDITKYDIPKFIYASETVTDTVYQTDKANNPIMICFKDSANELEESGEETNNDDEMEENVSTGEHFCLADSTKVLPVRPVIIVSKTILDTKEDTSNSENTNTSDESEEMAK